MAKTFVNQTHHTPHFGLKRYSDWKPNDMVFRAVLVIVRLFYRTTSRRVEYNVENIPLKGPAIIVANHISMYDAVVMPEVIVRRGRWPRMMVKDKLANMFFIGWILSHIKIISVVRGTDKAADALEESIDIVKKGGTLTLYPEGTYTKDPEFWPMTLKTGAARLALETGAPLIPIAQWAEQNKWHNIPFGKFVSCFGKRRKTLSILVGTEINYANLFSTWKNLDDKHGEDAALVLESFDDLIWESIVLLEEKLRGESAPEYTRFDRKTMKREHYVWKAPRDIKEDISEDLSEDSEANSSDDSSEKSADYAAKTDAKNSKKQESK
ncbi:MAG: 1-acyl-sn-glycerol-3-phosphate acyltransferase [Bifidobacteriaceae bacterium]|jgi:1-acyl-sn-glycerol-3-phosphate acyltransferase|nr:1-acyl-sn-glycerol-3-phosphate acyltransferase [Bifidobacteriaceae bacterium]